VFVLLLEYNYECVYDKQFAFCWLSIVDYTRIKVKRELLVFVIEIFANYSKFPPKFRLSSYLEQF